jgi:hypothetical protein
LELLLSCTVPAFGPEYCQQ